MKKEIKKEFCFYAPTVQVKEEIETLTGLNIAKIFSDNAKAEEEKKLSSRQLNQAVETLLRKSKKEIKRMTRMTVTAVLVEGELRFGTSECSAKDVFKKVIGRGIARKRALAAPVKIITIKDTDTLTTLFLSTAKTLVTK